MYGAVARKGQTMVVMGGKRRRKEARSLAEKCHGIRSDSFLAFFGGASYSLPPFRVPHTQKAKRRHAAVSCC